jgi:hypothetical protein
MTASENDFRKAQRKARDASRFLKKAVSNSKAKEVLVSKAKEASDWTTEAYKNSGADKVVRPTKEAAITTLKTGKEVAKKLDETTGITQKAKAAKQIANEHVVHPTQAYLDDKGISEKVRIVSIQTQSSYGDIRSLVKPYFEPETAREALENAKRELTTITACILQVSRKDAEGWMHQFGKVVSAKVAGVAGTATLFGLVSTFGTAGTGTAIANLSGAAATNATVAAFGFGGGMATGALVLSGFGLAVGMLTYKFLFSATPRDFDALPDEDRQIVETCGLLAAAIEEKLKEDPLELYADEAMQFTVALENLHRHLEMNADGICSNLNQRNAAQYRQHILKDFQPVILKGLNSYASKVGISPEGIIAGVFYSLLTRTALDGSVEEALVLDALRRSKTELNDATEAESSEYLSGLTPEQQRGVANNVKGIYHELLWVEEYNSTHTDTYAAMHESTTHQGSDVVIKSSETNEIQVEYQLKATDTKSYVTEHRDRYSDIEVLPTNEVAGTMEGVEPSGIFNFEITERVGTVSDNIMNNTVADRVFESGEYSGLAAAGFEAIKLMNGKTTLGNAGKQTIRTAANAAAATGITAYLFG